MLHRTQHNRNLLKTHAILLRCSIARLAMFGVTAAYAQVSDAETRLIFQAGDIPDWRFLEKRKHLFESKF